MKILALALLFSAPAMAASLGSYDITVTQDFTRTRSANISGAGGTLQTQDADGNIYRLTLPAGALVNTTRISLTPMGHKADHFPFPSGITAGVQIEPEGLILIQPGKLEVTLVRAPAIAQAVAFCHHEDGVDFHLCPATLRGSTLTYKLAHFSGYGLGSSSLSSAMAYADANPPTDRESTAEQTMGVAMQTAQDQYTTDPTSSDQSDETIRTGVTAALMKWTPPLANAIDTLARSSYNNPVSEDQALDYAGEYMSWVSHAQGLGTYGPEQERMSEGLGVIFSNMVDNVLRQCWAPAHTANLAEIINKAMRYRSLAAGLNLDGVSSGTEAMNDISETIKACMNFTVDFHSGMTTGTPRGNMVSQLDGSFLAFPETPDWITLTGDANLRFTSATSSMPQPSGCQLNFNHSANPAKIESLMFSITDRPVGAHGRTPVRPGHPVPPPSQPQQGEPTLPVLTGVDSLSLDIGSPMEAMVMNCNISGHVVNAPLGSFWLQDFKIAHTDELDHTATGKMVYTLKGWTQLPLEVGAVVATKDYNRTTSAGGATIQEITQLQVTHKPLPNPGHNPPGMGGAPQTPDQIKQKYEQLIRPSYPQAESDDVIAQKTETLMERWYDAALGAGDPLSAYRDEAKAEGLKILSGLMDRALQACSGGKPEMGARLAHWIRWAQGHDFISRQPGYDLPGLKRKVETCVRFSLNFNSELSAGEPSSEKYYKGKITASGVLKSKFDLDSNSVIISGSLPQDYTVSSYPKQPGCAVEFTPRASQTTVLDSVVKLGTVVYGEETIDLKALNFLNGSPSEGAKITCNGASQGVPTTLWDSTWFGLHNADQMIHEGQKRFVFMDWLMTGSPWATKTIDTPAANLIGEHTVLKLEHQPGE